MHDNEEASFDQVEPDLDLFPVDVDDGCDSEGDRSVDCSEAAAWHLLGRALGKHLRLRSGLCVVVAPGEAWIPVISRVAPKRLLRRPRRGLARAVLRGAQPEVRVHELGSVSGRSSVDDTGESVETELLEGKLVILVAGSLLAVPAMLRQAADRILLVPSPDRRCVVSVARELDPAVRRLNLRGVDFSAITPASLRLAYRVETTAGAFVQRLKAVAQKPPGKAVPLCSLHGVDEARRWADALRTDVASWRQGKTAWHDLSGGLLLAGPPGTGKTTLAASIAQHAGLHFVATSYAAWQAAGTGHLGDLIKALAASFSEARERAPSLIFIDELDSLGSRGGAGRRSAWWRAIINAVLEQLDGTIANEGVVVVAASNHPELIDPAILRAGRLEDRVDLEPPDTEALTSIFVDQLDGLTHTDVDLHRIAQMSAGLTGADVIRICKTARRSARHERRLVTAQDLLGALGGDGADPDLRELSRVAVHESGHAVVAASFPMLKLGDVSIVGRGHSAGRAAVSLATPGALTPDGIEALLAALLGGRAAEEVICGGISAGAGGGSDSDLGRATRLATSAELSFGMRTKGLIWYPEMAPDNLAALFARRPDLERAVQRRLDHAYARAKKVIEAKAPTVGLLAERLLARKALAAEEVAALIGNVRVAPVGPTLPVAPPDGGAGPSIH